MDDDAWSTRFVAIRGGTANLEMHHSPVDNGHPRFERVRFHHSCCFDGRMSVALRRHRHGSQPEHDAAQFMATSAIRVFGSQRGVVIRHA